MKLLFSYGSNSSEQLSERLHTIIVPGEPACLYNYIRIFSGNSTYWNGGVASVFPKIHGKVYGAIFTLTEDQITTLDHKFELGYDRVILSVYNEKKHTFENCSVFVKTDHTFEKPPSSKYLHAIKLLLNETFDNSVKRRVSARYI